MADRFPESFLDDLRAALPITRLVGEYVTYENGKGREGDKWACCPMHGESTPSFHANDEKGAFHCFGCGASGDHFGFLMQSQGLDFPDAVARVAELAGIALPEGSPECGKPPRAPEQPRHEKRQPQARAQREGRVPVAEYPYTDNDGNLLYEVVRFQIRLPDGSWAKNKDGKGTWKTFLQRRPSGLPDGSKVWGLREGDYIRRGPGKDWSPWDQGKADEWPDHEVRWFDAVEPTIYRHPEVEIAIAEGRMVIISEGEKDANTTVDLGFCGTTNSSGSKHWTAAHAAHFRDANVVICLDNDAAGDRADKLAKSMKGIARRIRVLNFAEHVPDFPEKGDVTDWVEHLGGTADQLAQILHELPDWRPKLPNAFDARSFTGIAGTPIEYDWMIEELIEHNGVVVFAGNKGAGKTFAVIDMGLKVAQGLQYGGKDVRQGVVVHIAVEDAAGVRMRIEGYRRHNDISPDLDIPYVVMGGDFSLMSDESVTKMIAAVKDCGEHFGMPVALVTIDTWSVATSGLNEIDGAEVGKVLTRVNRLREGTGATICLVHHMNATGNRVRGHTSIEANVSNVIEIRQLMTTPQNRNEQPRPVVDAEGRKIRICTLTKNKNGLDDIKWSMALEIVDLGRNSKGKKVTTCVCLPVARQRREERDERRGLQGDQKLVYEALVAALDDCSVDMPAGVRVGPQIKKAVPNAEFVAAVRRQMSFTTPEEEVEARNKELGVFLKRTTTALINAGYMGRDNDKKIVWSLGKDQRTAPAAAPPMDEQEPAPPLPADVQRELEGAGDDCPF